MITWIGDFVGFLLVLWVLWRYVVPPLRKAMNKQQETIRQQLVDSEQASQRLAAAEEKYSAVLAEARTEAAKIRDGARADAERIVVEMREQAEREVERIRRRGEEQLETERQQIIRELRAHAGTLSTQLAERLIRVHLGERGRIDATVDRLLDDLEVMVESAGEPATPGSRTKAAAGSASGSAVEGGA